MPYLILIFSIIQPIYALLPAMLEIIKKKTSKLSIFSIALAFAFLVYISTAPEGWDLSRHYAHIIGLRGLSFQSILTNASSGYILFDIYAWVINSLNLPKELFPASIVLASYYLVFSVFNDLKSRFLQDSSQIYIVLSFIIFWMTISYIGVASGLRGPFSEIIIVYLTYYLIFYKKLYPFIIGSVFAVFIHPYAFALASISLIAYLFEPLIKHPKFLILIGLGLTLSSKIVSLVIDYTILYLTKFNLYSPTYFDESSEFATGYLGGRNLIGTLMVFIIPRTPYFLAVLYLLTLKKVQNRVMYLMLSLMSIYIGLFYSYFTLSSRMISFFLFIFSIYIVYTQANKVRSKFDRLFLVIYTFSLILDSIATLYRFPTFILSSLPTAFTKPLLFALFGI